MLEPQQLVPSGSFVCLAEDRPEEIVAVKLLVASLALYCPDLRVVAFVPSTDDAFIRWARTFDKLTLHQEPIPGAYGWNGKPHALLRLLEAGVSEVWWMDSDVILTQDFRPHFTDLEADALVVAEEATYGRPEDDGARARAWGLPVSRILAGSVNTCVMRVTAAHIELLRRWKELLESNEYTRSQSRPWYERPTHMLGDQDVLTALLTSAEFEGTKIAWLRRGRDVIQYFGPPGYSPAERWRSLRHGLPPFIHEQGSNKSWHRSHEAKRKGARARFARLQSETSPYSLCARHFRGTIESELAGDDWLDDISVGGRFLRLIGFGNLALTGLPLALAQVGVGGLRRLSGRVRPGSSDLRSRTPGSTPESSGGK